MLSKNLKDVPVLVNSQRIEAIEVAINKYAVDTVILDDGFQQWKINKDLEIVTIDATDPFGNQYLLPRGILRQPLSTLKRADILVITKTNLNPDIQDIKDYLKQINPRGLIVEAVHKPVGFYRLKDEQKSLLALDTLKGKPVSLFCGIADPDSFENLIFSLGINFELMFRFPDHHRYTQRELKDIIEQSKLKNIQAIITTEKDAVRINDVLGSADSSFSLYVLRINLEIVQNEIFLKRILSIY